MKKREREVNTETMDIAGCFYLRLATCLHVFRFNLLP
jgi:hypothetical protein